MINHIGCNEGSSINQHASINLIPEDDDICVPSRQIFYYESGYIETDHSSVYKH